MAWTNRGHNTKAQRHRILERDGHRCVKCGTTQGPFEVDHINNTRGPNYDLDSNKQTLCKPCHRQKTLRETQQGHQRRAQRTRHPNEPHPGLR